LKKYEKVEKKKDEHYPVITTSLPNVANETQFYWNIAGTTLRCSPDLKGLTNGLILTNIGDI